MSKARRFGVSGKGLEISFAFEVKRGTSTVPSNLAEWPLPAFRDHVLLNGREGLKPFVAATDAVMCARPRYDAGPLPLTLRQRGLGCSTYALLNGIRAWQMWTTGRTINPTLGEIADLQSRACVGDETAASPLAASAVAELLQVEGIFRRTDAFVDNPIAAAGRMISGFGFAVLTSDKGPGKWRHAVTILPNVRFMRDTQGNVPPFMQLDSLGEPTVQAVDSAHFCELFYAHAGGGPNGHAADNQFLLCELNPQVFSEA